MSRLHALLRKRFGHTAFRPGQESLIRAVLDGHDALGILPTGGGKSLCYQLPSLLHGGVTLVVSPLISLMRDQERRARDAGISAVTLHSGLDLPSLRDALQSVRAGTARMVFVTPERMASARFRSALREISVRLVAIDEAHCVASWGHDFRPAYLRLKRVRPPGVPMLAITATATPAVQAGIVSGLGLRDPQVVVTSFDRPNLFWAVEHAKSTLAQVGRLARIRSATDGAMIVYAATRRRVVAVRRGLADLGVRIEAYHAGLPSRARRRVEQWFVDGRAPTLVATNAFGMGIDRADVRVVAHVDLPLSLEALYQEAGRAGRDGLPATARVILRRDAVGSRKALAAASDPDFGTLVRAARALRRAQDNAARPLTASEASLLVERSAAGTPVPTILARLESLGSLVGLSGPGETLLLARAGKPDRAGCQRLRQTARRRLGAADAYAASRGCRRRRLLRYFGEDTHPAPGPGRRPSDRWPCCDRCQGRHGGRGGHGGQGTNEAAALLAAGGPRRPHAVRRSAGGTPPGLSGRDDRAYGLRA